MADRRDDDPSGPFILGGAAGLLALLGLFLASAAQDGVFYGTGIALFVFVLIARHVGR